MSNCKAMNTPNHNYKRRHGPVNRRVYEGWRGQRREHYAMIRVIGRVIEDLNRADRLFKSLGTTLADTANGLVFVSDQCAARIVAIEKRLEGEE